MAWLWVSGLGSRGNLGEFELSLHTTPIWIVHDWVEVTFSIACPNYVHSLLVGGI